LGHALGLNLVVLEELVVLNLELVDLKPLREVDLLKVEVDSHEFSFVVLHLVQTLKNHVTTLFVRDCAFGEVLVELTGFLEAVCDGGGGVHDVVVELSGLAGSDIICLSDGVQIVHECWDEAANVVGIAVKVVLHKHILFQIVMGLLGETEHFPMDIDEEDHVTNELGFGICHVGEGTGSGVESGRQFDEGHDVEDEL
jgi:hypothetical protein